MRIFNEKYDVLYNSIDDAVSAIKNANDSPIYFRGQNKDWKIASSIHRLPPESDVKRDETFKTLGFIEWYKNNKELAQYSSCDYFGTDLPYWAIAQHYGYKTDLIDFTTSLDVARGFALAGGSEGDIGVIFCLWQSDINFITEITKKHIHNVQEKMLVDLLTANNFNPFFHIETLGVSRIHNQKGLFLFDVCGLGSGAINMLLSFSGNNKFFFKQTNEDADMSIMRTLYPAANFTEIKIEKYLNVINADYFWKNFGEKYDNLLKVEPLKYDLNHHFKTNQWSDIGVSVDTSEMLPRAGRDELIKVEINFSFVEDLFDSKKTEVFVKNWYEKVETNIVNVYYGSEITSKIFAEQINDVLTTLYVYKEYCYTDVAIVLNKVLLLTYTLIALAINNEGGVLTEKAFEKLRKFAWDKNDLDIVWNELRGKVVLEKLAERCWGESLFVEFRSSDKAISGAMLPKKWINLCKKEYKLKHLEKLKEIQKKGQLPPIEVEFNGDGTFVYKEVEEIKWEVMLGCVNDPKILFDNDDMHTTFVLFCLPWQFVMYQKFSRIYSASEITSFNIKETGRNKQFETYYENGALCSICKYTDQ